MSEKERAASDEPMVTDPAKAGAMEQTGGSGTGTPGSSNVAGQKDTVPARDPSETGPEPAPTSDERISR